MTRWLKCGDDVGDNNDIDDDDDEDINKDDFDDDDINRNDNCDLRSIKEWAWIRARQNPIGTLKKSVKYRYTLGFGGKSFHLFITGGRIGQDPSRICDEKTPDANPDTWTNT